MLRMMSMMVVMVMMLMMKMMLRVVVLMVMTVAVMVLVHRRWVRLICYKLVWRSCAIHNRLEWRHRKAILLVEVYHTVLVVPAG